MSVRRLSDIARCAAVALAALAVYACGEKTTPTPEVKKGLSMQPEGGVTVEFDTPETTLTILAHTPWELSYDVDWISPSATTGRVTSSGVPVVFALSKNSGYSARTGTVTIRTSESEPYTFTITQNAENTLLGVNRWIYNTMGQNYYWNKAVKSTAPPSNALGYDLFLDKLITSLPWASVQDTSNGENPATIDGHWNDGATARTDIYSYIKRTSSTRAESGVEQTFGMGVLGIIVTSTGRYVFLVSWVQPDGPAYNAGIRRGAIIDRFNSNLMDEDAAEAFYAKLQSGSGTTLNISTTDGTPYYLAARSMEMQPILEKKTLSSPGGKKVAYMAYNVFEWGPDRKFHNDLRNAFAEFKAAGATDLVLDLRYNPGGYVETCRVLTSLVANVGSGDVFAKLRRNDDYRTVPNPQGLNFYNEPNSMRLGKVYLLVTGRTASASEMVVNSLRGAGVEVVLVGTRTNGKNVGMDLFEFNDATGGYEMWPITFKILNSRDFCDYAGGFAPDYTINELYYLLNRGTPILPLGNPEEVLLKAALTLVDGGTPVLPKSTRSDARAVQALTTPPDPRGGAKYIPDTEKQTPR